MWCVPINAFVISVGFFLVVIVSPFLLKYVPPKILSTVPYGTFKYKRTCGGFKFFISINLHPSYSNNSIFYGGFVI